MPSLHHLRFAIVTLGLTLLIPTVLAQQRATSTNYQLPRDVQSGGGGDKSTSTNYVLDDTVGEGLIGDATSATYTLNAGYRGSLENFISLSCGARIGLGTIDVNGQATGSGTCVVETDADVGYSLAWQVTTGSGGTNTGAMINQYEETIAAYTPAVADVPDTWSIAATDSEWGARLRSSSTDTAAEWGTDGSSDKWLNVRTASARTIVTRSSKTTGGGSDEILQFRVEIGSLKEQPTGNYGVTVVMTALSL
jgi:hypothetical protein